MDKRILLTLALGAMSQVFTHAWEPKDDKIKTVWAEQVTPENVKCCNRAYGVSLATPLTISATFPA